MSNQMTFLPELKRLMDAATKAEELGYDMRLIQKRLAQVNISTTEGYIQSHKTPISAIALPVPWGKA